MKRKHYLNYTMKQSQRNIYEFKEREWRTIRYTLKYYLHQLYDFFVFGNLWWFLNIWKIMEVQESYYLQTFLNYPRNNLILIEHEQTLHHLIETSKKWKDSSTNQKTNDTRKWLIGQDTNNLHRWLPRTYKLRCKTCYTITANLLPTYSSVTLQLVTPAKRRRGRFGSHT